MTVGYTFYTNDPPPPLPPHWEPAADGSVPAEEEKLWNETEFWCQQQIRWWATLRGQTLGRTTFGLMEMRESLVDVVYLELKALQGFNFSDVDFHSPNNRSSYEDVIAWIQRNRYPLFRSGRYCRRCWRRR